MHNRDETSFGRAGDSAGAVHDGLTFVHRVGADSRCEAGCGLVETICLLDRCRPGWNRSECKGVPVTRQLYRILLPLDQQYGSGRAKLHQECCAGGPGMVLEDLFWRLEVQDARGSSEYGERRGSYDLLAWSGSNLESQHSSSIARRIRPGNFAGSSASLELSSSTMASGAASALRAAAAAGQSMLSSPSHRKLDLADEDAWSRLAEWQSMRQNPSVLHF